MWGKVLHACVCVGEGAVSAGVHQPWICLVKAADFRGGGGGKERVAFWWSWACRLTYRRTPGRRMTANKTVDQLADETETETIP